MKSEGDFILNTDVMAASVRHLAHHISSVLEGDGYQRLLLASYQIQSYAKKQQTRDKKSPLWEVDIDPENPVKFIESEVDPRLKPDLFCHITGPTRESKAWPVLELRFVIRIWSVQQDLSFRKELDASKIREMLEDKLYERVMLRYHFDSSDKGREDLRYISPLFHLQFGGDPGEPEKELCWFPSSIEIPRFLAPPIDLVLASEHIIANFFPSTFMELNKKPEWVSLVQRSERFFLSKFYQHCNRHCYNEFTEKSTILSSLCGLPPIKGSRGRTL